mmetsp:Transcript_98335/g.273515  ORF Transcript_98335/g.273515 Transcript_98335/m.273515 type:complete len:279 (+) Transcript_98335:54-890(+)
MNQQRLQQSPSAVHIGNQHGDARPPQPSAANPAANCSAFWHSKAQRHSTAATRALSIASGVLSSGRKSLWICLPLIVIAACHTHLGRNQVTPATPLSRSMASPSPAPLPPRCLISLPLTLRTNFPRNRPWDAWIFPCCTSSVRKAIALRKASASASAGVLPGRMYLHTAKDFPLRAPRGPHATVQLLCFVFQYTPVMPLCFPCPWMTFRPAALLCLPAPFVTADRRGAAPDAGAPAPLALAGSGGSSAASPESVSPVRLELRTLSLIWRLASRGLSRA